MSARPELPPAHVLSAQSASLEPMRSRLLRRAGVAHLGPVLELGAGTGAVTEELVRRCRGPVVALDRHTDALAGSPAHETVVSEAEALPFEDRRFALVFAQCFFLWNRPAARTRILAEAWRVLAPGGVLIAIEPDWGAATEHPEPIAIAPVVRAVLERAGADPLVGRQLPSELRRAGFSVRVELTPEVGPASLSRYAVLEGLSPTEAERTALERAREHEASLAAGEKLVHVPFVFVTATKRQ